VSHTIGLFVILLVLRTSSLGLFDMLMSGFREILLLKKKIPRVSTRCGVYGLRLVKV